MQLSIRQKDNGNQVFATHSRSQTIHDSRLLNAPYLQNVSNSSQRILKSSVVVRTQRKFIPELQELKVQATAPDAQCGGGGGESSSPRAQNQTSSAWEGGRHAFFRTTLNIRKSEKGTNQLSANVKGREDSEENARALQQSKESHLSVNARRYAAAATERAQYWSTSSVERRRERNATQRYSFKEESQQVRQQVQEETKQFCRTMSVAKQEMKTRKMLKTCWPGRNPLHTKTIDKINQGIARINEQAKRINAGNTSAQGSQQMQYSSTRSNIFAGWPPNIDLDELLERANCFIKSQGERFDSDYMQRNDLQQYMNEFYNKNVNALAPIVNRIPQKHLQLLKKYYEKQRLRESENQKDQEQFKSSSSPTQINRYQPKFKTYGQGIDSVAIGHKKKLQSCDSRKTRRSPLQNRSQLQQQEQQQQQAVANSEAGIPIPINLEKSQYSKQMKLLRIATQDYRSKKSPKKTQKLAESRERFATESAEASDQQPQLQQQYYSRFEDCLLSNSSQLCNSDSPTRNAPSQRRNIVYSKVAGKETAEEDNRQRKSVAVVQFLHNNEQRLKEWEMPKNPPKIENRKEHLERIFNKEFTPIVSYQLPSTLRKQLNAGKLRSVERGTQKIQNS